VNELKKYVLTLPFLLAIIALSGCIQFPSYATLSLHIRGQTIRIPDDIIKDEYYSDPSLHIGDRSIFGSYPYGAWIQKLEDFTIDDTVEVRITQVSPPIRCFLRDIGVEKAQIFWPLDAVDYPPAPGWEPDDAWFAGHTGHIYGVFNITLVFRVLLDDVLEVRFGGAFTGRIVNGEASVRILGNVYQGSGSIEVYIDIPQIGTAPDIRLDGRGFVWIPEEAVPVYP